MFSDPILKSPTKVKPQSGIPISFDAFTILLDPEASPGLDGSSPVDSDRLRDLTPNGKQTSRPIITAGSALLIEMFCIRIQIPWAVLRPALVVTVWVTRAVVASLQIDASIASIMGTRRTAVSPKSSSSSSGTQTCRAHPY